MNDHGRLMDGVYRYQRHVYDLTRKYYLLGRDGLISDLDLPDGGDVLEIGCGTGRNLIAVGKAWPMARLYGVDISAAMLETAKTSIERRGMADRTVLREGDACGFDSVALFGRPHFDRVFVSYALSMIPEWRSALEQAARCVAPGGRLEIVDFGGQDALPAFWRSGLFHWLRQFHVTPRLDLPEAIGGLTSDHGGQAASRSLYRGYAVRGTMTRAADQ